MIAIIIIKIYYYNKNKLGTQWRKELIASFLDS